MLMFTLTISCLTTFNLPWLMDLKSNIALYNIGISFHHQSHPQLGVISTGSVSSFFLQLFLHSSPVAYWATASLGSSSLSVLSFCLFILFIGFSRIEYWNGLPFLSSVDHILSELSTMTCPSWVALHDVAHSFIELDKGVVHVISLISFLWLWFSFCLPSDG